MKIREKNFMETFKNYLSEETLNSSSVKAAGKSIASSLVKKYGKHATTTSDRPSAPNTGSFIATSYGMIEIVMNQSYADGHGGMFRRNMVIGIKVGSNVDYKIYQKVRDEFKDKWKKSIRTGNDIITTRDSKKYAFASIRGTAYGLVGIIEL